MALSGKYELVKDVGQLEHLIATGVSKEKAQEFQNRSKTFEISINGNNVSLQRGNGEVQNWILGQETTEKTPDGQSMTSLANLNGNVLSVVTKGDWGEINRVYTLAGSELTVLNSSSKPNIPDGKRIYKKVQ